MGIFLGDGNYFRHINTLGPATTAAAQAAAGTGATCSLTNANDACGLLTLVLGSAGFNSGEVAKVSFVSSYLNPPNIALTPANSLAAGDAGSAHHIYATSATNSFSVNFGVQPNSAGATYVWFYNVIGMQ